jgi:molybdate transport system permease protein
MLNEFDLSALSVTLKLAAISTAILLLLGTPLAWWLSRTRCKLKALLEALIAVTATKPVVCQVAIESLYL